MSAATQNRYKFDAKAESMVAALFVERDGVYSGLPGVEVWDRERDARNYDGPWPVVAHPPCARWGKFANGAPRFPGRFTVGDDGGCFLSALESVRFFGGIIEHPEGSHAWRFFGLKPPERNGWQVADFFGGWTYSIDQAHYGHIVRKRTWLYASRVELPSLQWAPASRYMRWDLGFSSKEERARAIKTGICQRLSKRQRAATPMEFPRPPAFDRANCALRGDA